MQLSWLPEIADYRALLKQAPGAWDVLLRLARSRLDFVRTNAVDAALAAHENPQFTGKPIRLAVLSSCTVTQLLPAIRVGGLRREIGIAVHEGDFGQYWQELNETHAALYEFQPNATLIALDAHHLAAGVNAAMLAPDAAAALEEIQTRIVQCWRLAKKFGPVIHQTPLPLHHGLMGNNEHRLPGSKAGFIARLNAALRPLAAAEGVELLALDERVAQDGLAAWHDAALWHRAKQEIFPGAAPLYGDMVARILAAAQGRSAKCLVLDLDNTIWGGVIGDDGLAGIELGQGSTMGEAFAAFQDYARELSRRGVILAVCSKNDEANALEAFEKHPEMVLRRGDIASFVANWSDKPSNIKAIAAELNIGLDSLVFVDDNPFERALVRQELPMVAVPEVGDDPVDFPRMLADAGYFESLAITEEDRERGGQYQGNRLREALRSSTTDLPSYLRGLEMRLVWRRFDAIGLSRTVQLINKTNQFNLTTRRYTEAEVQAVMEDDRAFGLQLRLTDRFGDNGIISIIIGKMQPDDELLIDTWLMSCRVLGRQVEPTTLNLIAEQAKALGARRLVGEYIPTKKNAMVKDHYAKLGFLVTETDETGASRAMLELDRFSPAETFIDVTEG